MVICESMSLAGYLETHAPLVHQAQVGPTHYPPIMGSRFSSKLGVQAPTRVPDSVRCKDLHPKTTLTVDLERAGTHDKRVTSLPCAHTQVCARDNKSMTYLEPNTTVGP